MTTDLQVVDQQQTDMLPSEQQVERTLGQIEVFRKLVRSRLIPDHDFGTIPGTQKPTLLKPGAEKIAKLAGLADEYLVTSKVEDWDKPLFSYEVTCSLRSMRTGAIVSQGLGECNSHESKYRYRSADFACPECGASTIKRSKFGSDPKGWYCFDKIGGCGLEFPADQFKGAPPQKVENPDVADQKNTILKMARKRALVDAALSVGALSDLFTQDIEPPEQAQSTEQTKPPAQRRQRAPRQAPKPKTEGADPMGLVEFNKNAKERDWSMTQIAEWLKVKIVEGNHPAVDWVLANPKENLASAFKECERREMELASAPDLELSDDEGQV